MIWKMCYGSYWRSRDAAAAEVLIFPALTDLAVLAALARGWWIWWMSSMSSRSESLESLESLDMVFPTLRTMCFKLSSAVL